MYKIKLYKGPRHGKTMVVVDPNQPVLIYASTKGFSFNLNPDDYDPNIPLPLDRHVYSMKIVSTTIGGVHYRAPAMHPDGTIIFTYDRTIS